VVNFINILHALLALIFWHQKKLKSQRNSRKSAQFAFVQKMRALNVDEIDPWMD